MSHGAAANVQTLRFRPSVRENYFFSVSFSTSFTPPPSSSNVNALHQTFGATGAVSIGGVRIDARDGAAITCETVLEIVGIEESEIVLVDAA